MPVPTGLTAQLRALLADGQWHPLPRLLAILEAGIRPESAVRIYQDLCPGSRRPLSHQVVVGRRRILLHTLAQIHAERRGPALRPLAQEYRLPRPEERS